jgi:Uma2 family endonuclease
LGLPTVRSANDMGIYTDPERPPIVPDGFLCLNVERHYDEDLRLSYLLWDEEVSPILVLEVVSTNPGGEYTTKLDAYTRMGVLYYVIYSLVYQTVLWLLVVSKAVGDIYLWVSIFLVGAEPGSGGTDPQPPR